MTATEIRMLPLDDGGPAYPQPCTSEGHAANSPFPMAGGGVSVRDFFASSVVLTNEDLPDNHLAEIMIGRKQPNPNDDPINCWIWHDDVEALIRGMKADAMIRERSINRPAS